MVNILFDCPNIDDFYEDLKEYFSGFSWYKPKPNFSESDFTEIERKNIELIRQMENQE